MIEPVVARPHGLPGPLVVSVASYRPRFPGLATAMASLLSQDIAADVTILWIDAEEMDDVPGDVRRLEGDKFEIRPVRGSLRSYKKLVPALAAFPSAFVVTADDDVVYRADWLRTLVAAYAGRREIICHRAHRIMLWLGRYPRGYRRWRMDIPEGSSPMNLATGVGGILYPPEALDPEVANASVFKAICPIGDDLWFHWMARMRGAAIRKVGPRFVQDLIAGSQEVSLYRLNALEGRMNDVQIKAMIRRYGKPWKFNVDEGGLR